MVTNCWATTLLRLFFMCDDRLGGNTALVPSLVATVSTRARALLLLVASIELQSSFSWAIDHSKLLSACLDLICVLEVVLDTRRQVARAIVAYCR